MPTHSMKNIVVNAELQIVQRFDGKILPWKPIFEFELNWLNYLKLIRYKNDKILIYDKWGHEIGEVIGVLKFVPGVRLFEIN